MLLDDSEKISKLDYVDPERNYWFVRTDAGIYFDAYLKYGFIGIGWNPITLEDLTKLTPQEVKVKIAHIYNIDLGLVKGKGKASGIYNKLIRFKDIKNGDVVIMPSYSSTRLAFGIVEDSSVYIDIDKSHDCDYYKRKRIRWVSVKQVGQLDPIFYEIIISRHAISNIKRYENYIDRVVSTFYFKNNSGNLVFDVNKKEDINLAHLVDLIGSIQTLISEINDYYSFGENIEESAIKLSLQSKGTFALKVPNGKSLATFGLIFTLFSCGDNDSHTNISSGQDMKNAQDFIHQHEDTLRKIERRMIDLEIDREKINETFQ